MGISNINLAETFVPPDPDWKCRQTDIVNKWPLCWHSNSARTYYGILCLKWVEHLTTKNWLSHHNLWVPGHPKHPSTKSNPYSNDTMACIHLAHFLQALILLFKIMSLYEHSMDSNWDVPCMASPITVTITPVISAVPADCIHDCLNRGHSLLWPTGLKAGYTPITTASCTLLLGGDIELNPVPQASSIFLCGYCECAVNWSNQAICCDNCSIWFQRLMLMFAPRNTSTWRKLGTVQSERTVDVTLTKHSSGSATGTRAVTSLICPTWTCPTRTSPWSTRATYCPLAPRLSLLVLPTQQPPY